MKNYEPNRIETAKKMIEAAENNNFYKNLELLKEAKDVSEEEYNRVSNELLEKNKIHQEYLLKKEELDREIAIENLKKAVKNLPSKKMTKQEFIDWLEEEENNK